MIIRLAIFLFLFLVCFAMESEAGVSVGKSEKTVGELASLLLGGIGIFLVGIHFAGDHLQKMAGGKFQRMVSMISKKKVGILASGLLLGFLTQSGKAVAFILSDFVQAGLLTTIQSASIVFWGNAGSSLIVFASMLTVKMFALCLLGVTALGMTFGFPHRLKYGYGVLFGLGMIMYGLYLVKGGAAGFAGNDAILHMLENLQGLYILSFIAGLILTLLVQSNIAIMMILIALTSAHILHLEEAAMGIFGAQAGTGILTYIFSFHSHGRARQVVGFQIAFDVFIAVGFFALFYVEKLFGIPLLLSAGRAVSHDVGTQAMTVALVCQFSGALVLVSLRNPVLRKIEKIFPPSQTEVLSQTAFLRKGASDSPQTALLLVEKEQLRLLERLPQYIEYTRLENPPKGTTTPKDFHDACREIALKISETLARISSHSMNEADSDELIRITKLQEQLVGLEEVVFKLTQAVARKGYGEKAAGLGMSIIESIDFMVMTGIDAIGSHSESEIETLDILTQDRTELMAKIRHNYFSLEDDLSSDDRNFILDVTVLLEKAVQILGRYGAILKA